MNKFKLSVLLLIAVLVGGLIALVLFSGGKPEKAKALLGAAADFNLIDAPTHSNTSTSTGLPVKLLSRNYNRIYGLCESSPANTLNIGIFFGNFADNISASTSVTPTSTILLAPGGSYEILPENMMITDVWAATNTSAQAIRCVDR